MSETEFVYHLIFLLFSFCIIYPPTEFVSIGLTINHIFGTLLGAEDIEFVQYHLRRTCFTLIAHTFLPFLYITFYYLKFDDVIEYDANLFIQFMCWNSLVIFSLISPMIGIGCVYYWWRNDYERHPIVNNLRKYCNNDNNWERAAADVNAEFRR